MSSRVRFTPAILFAFALPSLFAQTPVVSTSKPDDEVVHLSPFTVTSDDDSWTATTTLVGTRTNQDLAKVPASVDVITSEFIKDLGLGSLEDAASFVAGLTVQPRFEARNDDSRVSYRGLTGSNTTSRNFFMWYVPADTYNVERFDFSRGANSLMFGDSAPGGQTTIYTKRPRRNSLTELYGSYASFGSSRLQLDISRPITKQLAFRVNAVSRIDRTYVHHNYQRLKAADLSLSYRPFRGTTLVIEGERGTYIRSRADNALAIQDVAAPGLAFNQNNRWYLTSDGTIFQRPSSSISGANTTAARGNAVPLLSGQSVDVAMPGGITRTYHGFSRYLDVLGTTDYLNRPYNVFSATLDQTIGKLDLELAYNQQFQHQDRNDNSFGTSQTPPTISVDGNGRPFLDETGTAQYKVFGNIVKAGRISAAYPFEFGRWMKQYVVISAMRQKDDAHNRRYFLANDAAAGTLQNNLITLRAYLDDPRVNSDEFWDQFQFQNMPRTATFHPAIYETYVSTAPFVDIRYNRNLSVSASGSYWGGRLSSMFGVSWSRISRKIPAAFNYKLDARGMIVDPGSPEDNPAAYTYDPGYDLGARSIFTGATYQLIKSDNFNLNVYGDYSQSFNWQSGQTFYGQVLGPILGATHEAGFKGDLFKQSLFVSFSIADTKRQNVAYVWNPDSLSAVQLEDLINPNNLTPGDPGYLTVVTGILGSERRTVNSHEESKSGELTLQAKRTHGLQARVTLSRVLVQGTPDLSVFKAYLDAAVARTNAALAPGGDPTLAESATNIANAQTIYSSNTATNKVQGLRSAPWQGSFVLDYEVPRVKGLRIGLNGVYVSNYNIGIFNGTAYTGGTRFPLGAYAIYDRKIAGEHCSFRLGVQNLYDVINGNSEYRKTGTTGFNAAANTPNYILRYIDPAVYSLSVDVKF